MLLLTFEKIKYNIKTIKNRNILLGKKYKNFNKFIEIIYFKVFKLLLN